MNQGKTRLILIVSVFILLIVVLGFTAALNISSYRANYTDSLAASYSVAGGNAVRNIEYAAKYGKPLDSFYGIEKLLAEVKGYSPNIENVRVSMVDGRITYDLQGKVVNTSVPDELNKKLEYTSGGKTKSYLTLLYENKYHVFLPINDRTGTRIGNLEMIFDKQVVDSQVTPVTNVTLKYMLIIIAVTAVLMALCLYRFKIIDEQGVINRKLFYIIVLSILGVAQLVYGYINFSMFTKTYVNMAQENTNLTAKIIQKEINSVISRGVSYQDLHGIEDWMNRIISSVREIDSISLNSGPGNVLYQTGAGGAGAMEKEGYSYSMPLISDNTSKPGEPAPSVNINIRLSEQYIRNLINNITLDALTVLITSVFFMVEISIFLMLFLKRQIKTVGEKVLSAVSGAASSISGTDIVRPLAFVFFIASSMSVSYIPVMMKQLYRPIAGLSEGVVLGLPISMEILCIIISIIFAGYLIERRGWRMPLFMGFVLLAAGLLFSGLAAGAASFILARGVAGLGYGLSWMAMRSYSSSAETMAEKTAGLSAYNAGVFAGFNCGIVIGALLADRIGYANVFFVALAVVALTALFAWIFTDRVSVKPEHLEEKQISHGLQAFFKDPKVIGFFVLIIIPVAVCSMFMDYFFPLFGASIDLSSSNIGRSFLLYGLCVIYLGPILSGYLEKRIGVRSGTIISTGMVGLALLLFASQGTLWAALAAILLMGMADSFGLVAQNNYYLSLPASQRLGESTALAYFSTIRRLGQMAGPFIFGGLAILGPAKSVGVIGIAAMALLAAFILAVQSNRGAEADSTSN
ncbi:MAG: MFS transporter [Firmicutes bacterium]|nr:MFS transporter [Bacillota bacterium]